MQQKLRRLNFQFMRGYDSIGYDLICSLQNVYLFYGQKWRVNRYCKINYSMT